MKPEICKIAIVLAIILFVLIPNVSFAEPLSDTDIMVIIGSKKADKLKDAVNNGMIDANFKNGLGIPLIYLVVHEKSDTINKVKFLLENGADPNELTPHKTSALMIAVLRGNEDLVKLFLEYGARTDLKDPKGRTIGQLAETKGNKKIIDYISNPNRFYQNSDTNTNKERKGLSQKLSSQEIADYLPVGQKTFKKGHRVQTVNGKQYIYRPVESDQDEKYFLLTEDLGNDSEKLIEGKPAEYILAAYKTLAPSSGMNPKYWDDLNKKITLLGEELSPRNADTASMLFSFSRLGMDVGQALITGGASGLSFTGTFIQAFKQATIGPRVKGMVWVYEACKSIDYLKALGDKLPSEKEFYSAALEKAAKANIVYGFGKPLAKVTSEWISLINSQGWAILKETSFGTAYVKSLVSPLMQNQSVAIGKMAVMWGLDSLEDEFRRYVLLGDTHVAVLKAISKNLANDIDQLSTRSLSAVEEIELREKILQQQLFFYKVYEELLRESYNYAEYVRTNTNWKGKVAVSQKALKSVQKSKEKVEKLTQDYSEEYLSFRDKLATSIYYYPQILESSSNNVIEKEKQHLKTTSQASDLFFEDWENGRIDETVWLKWGSPPSKLVNKGFNAGTPLIQMEMGGAKAGLFQGTHFLFKMVLC